MNWADMRYAVTVRSRAQLHEAGRRIVGAFVVGRRLVCQLPANSLEADRLLGKLATLEARE
jgi:hypothetical protein